MEIVTGDPDSAQEVEAGKLSRPLRRRITERVPAAYPIAVFWHRTRRRVQWIVEDETYTNRHDLADLPVRIKRHKSLLLRQLGESEMRLQHNKVSNLRLIAPLIDGVILRPGETFSFCRLVGRTTRRRGFVEGMLLSNGDARPGVGGGICQAANLLHWMVLHSPLTIVERSSHSFDPFPDNQRVLPWGVGCAVFYNYVDLRFRNDTEATFQVRLSVGDRYLEGDLRADREMPYSYRVHERNAKFTKCGDDYYRSNEIWRKLIDRRTGQASGEELVKRNHALVKYVPKTLGTVPSLTPGTE